MAKLSAVEFALCVLSMFGRVMDENRMAVQVLLEAIQSYNPMTRQFGKRAVKQAGYGGRSSLRAIAAFLGKDYNMKELRTEEASRSPISLDCTVLTWFEQGAQSVLHTILDPVIGSLTREELVKMRRDMVEAMRLASSAPVEEVRVGVVGFIRKACENGRREHWMGVWEKGMEAQETGGSQVVDTESDQPISNPETESICNFAVVPMMSTLQRRAHVTRNRRTAPFPSPMDVCLGRCSSPSSASSTSTSDERYKENTRIWHPHGWKMFYPATASNRKKASPAGFEFPPAGTISTTATTVIPTMTSPVDPEQALEMSAKLKRWEDEWETQQLGTWKAAIQKDNALWFIVEYTRDKKILHPHGWKKLDATARSAHKKTGFKFPAPGSSTVTITVESERRLDTDIECEYRKWEDSWETAQLGRWSAGLKMSAKKDEGGLWNRLAMAWKSEKVDLWAGMVGEGVDGAETTGSTTLAGKVGRLFGLA